MLMATMPAQVTQQHRVMSKCPIKSALTAMTLFAQIVDTSGQPLNQKIVRT